ncbi:HNH endonuclease signature motif containing protein [Streptomyces sp. NPDC057596]|uniref:HNH endonuclease n=1 Tax=unclassified Streptomyces TaxID=2593676 RepID=UPI003425EED4
MSNREDLTAEMRCFLHCRLKELHGPRCFYCRRKFGTTRLRRKTLDHYIPYRIWPGWNIENLVLACERCNNAKADSLPWPVVWLLLSCYAQQSGEGGAAGAGKGALTAVQSPPARSSLAALAG